MTYCHECGEEIAEIDTFCPFCGISLQPIIQPSDEVKTEEESKVVDTSVINENPEDSQEDTIAISGSELSDFIGSDESLEKEVEFSPVSKETTKPVNQSENLPEGEGLKTVSEDKEDSFTEDVKLEPPLKPTFQTEPEEFVPEERLLFTARTLNSPKPEEKVEHPIDLTKDDSDSVTTEPGFSFSEPAPEEGLSDQKEVEIEPPQVESSPQTESSMMSYEEAKIKEKTSVEEISEEKEEVKIPKDFENDEFSTTLPVVDPEPDIPVTEQTSMENAVESPVESKVPEKKHEIPVAESEEIPVAVEPPEISTVPETPELLKDDLEPPTVKDIPEVFEFDPIFSETPPETEEKETDASIADEPIAPPLEELEEPEIQAKFDSVRIRTEDEPEADKIDFSKEMAKDFDESPLQPEEPIERTSPKAEVPSELPTPPVKPDEPIDEPRSYTTPNIGGPDTDGKKSKLKPLDEGTVLNERYEIIRKIGGGGMGAVYLASDKNLGGVLRAVKEMVQSYIGEDQQEKAINDFKRESLLLTSLEHPAIPTIYDYFYDKKEARFYLVMKYINGGDLSSRLRSAPEGQVDEQTVTEWAIQVADVLNYLHNRQPPIVYRDLKPANIMIDGNSGRVMLIDFGIARWINKEEKGVTAVGTMGYAPPELFSGNVEPNSDIYSLGSTIFHLLTGSDPQNNPLLIFDFQKNPKPRQINPKLSDQMERILMRMVEYNADKRHPNALELKQELEKHLENLKSGKVSYGVKQTPAATSLKDEKVFCGFCGQNIVASDLFCAFCGAKQPIASKGVHAEHYAPATLTAKLVIMGTNELEPPAYKIEKDENLVGRRDPMSNIFPEVDLSKFDPQTKISRRHARIWRDGKKYMIEDLGSSNGTVLIPVVSETTRLMPNQPHILTNGDKLKLGDTTLHFVIG